MNKVILEELFFHAYHGVFEEEKKIGGKFEVNLEITTDFTEAMRKDQLEGTVDYSKAYEIIAGEMKIPSQLIEHVGYRIVEKLKRTFNEIEHIVLKISKLNPPISGEIGKVSIVIED